MEVPFEGNVYVMKDDGVYKRGSDGDKKVGNPEKVKQILDSITPAPVQEPVVELPALIKTKPNKKK